MGLFGGNKKKRVTSRPMRTKKRAEEKKEEKQDSGTCLCFLLLADANPLDPAILQSVVESSYGSSAHVDAGEGDDADDSTVMVSAGDKSIGFIGHMPMPIPEDEASHAAEGNPLWPDGGAEASEHASHCIIAYMGGGDDVAERKLGLTKLASAAIRAAGDRAIGIYWGDGSIANKAEVFSEFATDASEEHLPLPLWLRYQFVSGDNDEIGIYTVGLEQFNLMDIEVLPLKYDPGELHEFVYNISAYLVSSGPVIKDGDTIGGSEEERIRVFYKPCMYDEQKTVYQIQLPPVK